MESWLLSMTVACKALLLTGLRKGAWDLTSLPDGVQVTTLNVGAPRRPTTRRPPPPDQVPPKGVVEEGLSGNGLERIACTGSSSRECKAAKGHGLKISFCMFPLGHYWRPTFDQELLNEVKVLRLIDHGAHSLVPG